MAKLIDPMMKTTLYMMQDISHLCTVEMTYSNLLKIVNEGFVNKGFDNKIASIGKIETQGKK